jgi:hypothetical protein
MSNIFDKMSNKANPLLRHILRTKIFYMMPDELYLRIMFRLIMRKRLHLENPIYFNEKLQWLKLYYRSPLYPVFTDKYAVRKYVADTIGEKYLVPMIGIWDSFDEIEFNELPDQFILKCTHDSGGVLVCRDKKNLDIGAAARQFKRQLKNNYFFLHREWSYKDIKPRIICEKLIEAHDGSMPMDYKFHCFNGNPDSVMVCSDRHNGQTKFTYYDRNWELLKYNLNGISPTCDVLFPKPEKLDEMFDLAKTLSSGIPYVRVDLYHENAEIYFGEMTLYSDAGFDSTMLEETDLLFGKKLDLRGIQKSFR